MGTHSTTRCLELDRQACVCTARAFHQHKHVRNALQHALPTPSASSFYIHLAAIARSVKEQPLLFAVISDSQMNLKLPMRVCERRSHDFFISTFLYKSMNDRTEEIDLGPNGVRFVNMIEVMRPSVCAHCCQAVEYCGVVLGQPYNAVYHKHCLPHVDFNRGWPHPHAAQSYRSRDNGQST